MGQRPTGRQAGYCVPLWAGKFRFKADLNAFFPFFGNRLKPVFGKDKGTT